MGRGNPEEAVDEFQEPRTEWGVCLKPDIKEMKSPLLNIIKESGYRRLFCLFVCF